MEICEDRPDDISCTSYYWIYLAADTAGFEARRALAHLARREKAGTVNPASADLEDVHRYIRAGNELVEAASVALRDVVAEARRRGATWASIAADLNVGTTAAQKRFRLLDDTSGPVDSTKFKTAIDVVTITNQATDVAAKDRLPEDELAHDIRADIKPETYFRSAVLRLVRKAFEYEASVYRPYRKRIDGGGRFAMPAGWWKAISELTAEFKSGVWDLARSGAIGALFERNDYWPVRPFVDESPGLYLSYACFHAAMSVEYLNRMVGDLTKDDLDDFHNDIEMAFRHQKLMIEIFSRPECLAIVQVVNWSLSGEVQDKDSKGEIVDYSVPQS